MVSTALIAPLRITRKRRLLLALFAVPAILIGLLAMHVFTTASADSSAPLAAASHHMGATPLLSAESAAIVPSSPATADDCDGLCSPSHDMLGMICVLALLVTLVLLTVHLVAIRWEQPLRAIKDLAARASALVPPVPPSLIVLSISRT